MTETDKSRWRQMPSGDWAYERGEGEGAGEDVVRLGSVVFEDVDGRRVWLSVSIMAEHGPEAGGLSKCKRRVEGLWR